MKKVIVSLVLAAVMMLIPFASYAAGSVTSTSSRGVWTNASNSTSAAKTEGSVQKQADGSQVFVKPDGSLLRSAWAVVESNGTKVWNYFDADGKMMTGWAWIAGKDGVKRCYYLGTDGACFLNGKTPDGYLVNSEGQWIDNNGIVQTR